MNSDYQWPSPDIRFLEHFSHVDDDEKSLDLINKIENYFQLILNTNVLLMPSGRASLSLICKYYKLNRMHDFFAPKYTSHCVWDIVTRYANPETENIDKCNVTLMVHKWAEIEKTSIPFPFKVIEDSVDSIFINGSTLFPNGGEFEIISLPKIIGSYTGGLLISKNKAQLEELKSLRTYDTELAKHQSFLRYQYANQIDVPYSDWGFNEHQNAILDLNGLINIEKCLSNYLLNQQIIQERLNYITNNTDIRVNKIIDRLPPVFCVECGIEKDINSDIMIRTKNFSGFADKTEYRKVGLIPLHFGATDDFFKYCLNTLCKN